MTEQAKHTPGWRWGSGWGELPEDEYEGDGEYETIPKYADCRLYDSNGRILIDLRMDHRQWLFDHERTNDAIEPKVRALIAAAPETAAERDALRELCGELVEACRAAMHSLRDAHMMLDEALENEPETCDQYDGEIRKINAAVARAREMGVGLKRTEGGGAAGGGGAD